MLHQTNRKAGRVRSLLRRPRSGRGSGQRTPPVPQAGQRTPRSRRQVRGHTGPAGRSEDTPVPEAGQRRPPVGRSRHVHSCDWKRNSLPNEPHLRTTSFFSKMFCITTFPRYGLYYRSLPLRRQRLHAGARFSNVLLALAPIPTPTDFVPRFDSDFAVPTTGAPGALRPFIPNCPPPPLCRSVGDRLRAVCG